MVAWLVSRKAADRLPTWKFALLYACTAIVTAVVTAAICILSFHMPLTGPFGIRYWVSYGAGLTVFGTGFALLGRHMRMRRR
jgi:hypothetical protein